MFDADEQPDYEFKEKVIKGYEHCHRFCQSIPQDLLEEKGPMYAQFGRMKMFYKCAMVSNNILLCIQHRKKFLIISCFFRKWKKKCVSRKNCMNGFQ